ncbi:MAG: hypothetical protein KC431_26205, partial [Myxococcales bacterium]|nr:hypothetical protein [Myxococcales bacterium]
GTGRGGGGTGEGFGIGLGSTGLIGFGGGGKWAERAKEAKRSSGPAASGKGEFAGFAGRGFGARGLSRNSGWSRQQAMAGDVAGAFDVPSVGAAAGFDADLLRAETSLDGRFAYGAYGYVRPWPQALHSNWDARLDDLGELAPALFEDGFDLARETLLLTGLDAEANEYPLGLVTDEAQVLIDGARMAQGGSRYALPEGAELSIDEQGRFTVVGERWGFLDERVAYDGETLRADYPELGLSVRRQVGSTSPALLEQWVPWMVPPAEHLRRFY